MKHRFLHYLILLMALFVSWAASAQTTVTIGTSTSSSGYYLPVNMFYHYSLTQQIYTAGEIGYAGTINSIAFQYAYSSSFSMSGTKVYMKHVSKSSFDSTTDMVDLSDATLVFDGTFAASGAGWVSIPLNTPFEYNGSDNLLVCFYDATSGYPGSAYKFYYTNTSTNTSIVYYSDSVIPNLSDLTSFSGSKSRYAYRANIQINITPTYTFGGNATSTSNYSPYGGFYGWEYYVYLYDASDVDFDGTVSSISFKSNNATEASSDANYTIYMKDVPGGTILDASTTFATYINGLTPVLPQTSMPALSAGWNTTSLGNTFLHESGNSILVMVKAKGCTSGGGCSKPVYYVSKNNHVWQKRQDNSDPGSSTTGSLVDYLPSVKFGYTPTVFSCPRPNQFRVTGFAQTATLTWYGTAASYSVAHSTDATANPADVIVGGTELTSYVMTDLALNTDHYFWVRANCDENDESKWTGPVGVYLGYCTPAPTSVDRNGISNVTYGMGALVVNNDTHTSSAPYYGDYTEQVGGVPVGSDASVAITYSTGFTYGTIIWVDWDNSLSFEDNEIVYTGTSTNSTPTTLTATFPVPANQAPGNYRMRIGGADSYFDSYIGGTATADHSPCYSGSYAVFEDYTLRVLYCAPPTNVAVNNVTGHSAEISWEGDAGSYNVRYRTMGAYTVFFEDFENGIPSTWTKIDADGDGNNWLALSDIPSTYSYYSSIPNWAHNGNDAASSPSFANGVGSFSSNQWLITPRVELQDILKFWVRGTHDSDLDSYEVLLSTTGNNPNDFTVTLQSMTTTVNEYEEVVIDLSHYAGQQGYIAIHHVSENMYFLVVDDFGLYSSGSPWVTTTTSNSPITITGLDPETYYEVQVQADCGTEDGTSAWVGIGFSTDVACPAPTNVAVNNVTNHSAEISWEGEAESYNLRYRVFDTTFVFFEDFEAGIPSTWTMLDNDADGNNWLALSDVATTYPYYEAASLSEWAHGGSNSAVSPSAYNNESSVGGYTALDSDHWLISPQLDLQGILRFYVRSADGNYPDSYEVLLSTSGNSINDFTVTLQVMTQAGSSWEEIIIDLASYAEQTGYIAIHHVAQDMYFLLVDDFGLYPDPTWLTITASDSPITITDLNPETQYEVQVQANCGAEDGVSVWTSTTFTTTIACPEPTDFVVTDVTSHGATLNWNGTSESYNVTYATLASAYSFEDGMIPSDFMNGTTPWMIWETNPHSGTYCLASSNYNSGSTTATISLTATFEEDGSIEFYSRVSSESASWDYGTFLIDGVQKLLEGGTTPNTWANHSYEVSAGTHIFTWNYTKDGSVNSGEDRYYIDDIVLNTTSLEWVTLVADDTTYTLTDLIPETLYKVKVQSNCGDEGLSVWSNTVNFTTEVACMPPTNLAATGIDAYSEMLTWEGEADSYNVRYITSVFLESFEEGLGGWTVYPGGDAGAIEWYVDDPSQSASLTAHSGNNVVWSFSDANVHASDWLVSPELDLGGTLKYWAMSEYQDAYEVKLSTTGIDTDDFTVTLRPLEASDITWTEVSIDLSAYEGQRGRIAFHHDHTGGFFLMIDDIGIYGWSEPMSTDTTMLVLNDLDPETEYSWQVQASCGGEDGDSRWVEGSFITGISCYPPMNLIVSDVTAHRATVTWDAEEGVTFQYSFPNTYHPNINPETLTYTDIQGNSKTLTNLRADTDYGFYLRKNCGADGYSEVVFVTFHTPEACPAPTNIDVANVFSHSATLTWDDNGESYNVMYRSAAYMDGVEEGFNSSSIPDGWTRYSGALNNDGTASWTSTSYGWYFGTSNGVFNSHAHMNIYSTNQYALVTPSFTIGDDFALSFDVAYTSYSGTLGTPATTGTDDRFAVLISTDNMAHWTILREWNNSGSSYVLNNIAHSASGQNVNDISLNAYAGQTVYIAFYGASTTSNADNNIHIDNVYIGLSYEAGEWMEAFTDEAAIELVDLLANTPYEVKVQSDCGSEGTSAVSEVFTFTTLESCPQPKDIEVSNVTRHTATVNWTGDSESFIVSYRTTEWMDGIKEEFNSSSMPSGWTQYTGMVDNVIVGSTTLSPVSYGWNTSSYAFGSYNASLNIYGTGRNNWLVTPEFTLADGSSLNFDLALTDYYNSDPIEDVTAQADDRFVVLVYADNAWTILREWNNSGSAYVYNTIATTGENVTIDLSAYNGKTVKIAFYGESTVTGNGDNDMHIDNVAVGLLHTAGEWQTVTATDVTAILTGLESGTIYDLKITPSCDETNESDIANFTTMDGSMKIFLTQGDWGDAINWMDEEMPNLTDMAVLRANATITGVAEADQITFEGSSTLTIADGGQLKTNNDVLATMKKNIAGYGTNNASNDYGYYLITAPTVSYWSAADYGLITADSLYDLYSWNRTATDEEWYNTKNNSSDFYMYNGMGYLYANENDVEMSFTYPVKSSSEPMVMTPEYDEVFKGWNLYGNPFPCDAYVSTEAEGMAFYRLSGNVFVAATGAIHPMEGFFAQAIDVNQTFSISREAPAKLGQLDMSLIRNGSETIDNALIVFGEGVNLKKMSFRENGSKVYMTVEGQDCAAVFTGEVGEMPISFKAEENGSYMLSFNSEGVEFSYLHLIDTFTGEDIDLLDTSTGSVSSYTFEARTTDKANRFKLVFAVER